MAGDKAEVLMLAPKQAILEGLEKAFTVHKLWEAPEGEALLSAIAPRVRAIASTGGPVPRIDAALMSRLPELEIVSSFGVGYDHVDAGWAGAHGIVVTNTPDVLTEEVADTALGLLLCTVREFPQAERYLRAGKWVEKNYPSPRRRCATAPSAWWASAASARRSRAASTPCRCRSSIMHGTRSRTCP